MARFLCRVQLGPRPGSPRWCRHGCGYVLLDGVGGGGSKEKAHEGKRESRGRSLGGGEEQREKKLSEKKKTKCIQVM